MNYLVIMEDPISSGIELTEEYPNGIDVFSSFREAKRCLLKHLKEGLLNWQVALIQARALTKSKL